MRLTPEQRSRVAALLRVIHAAGLEIFEMVVHSIDARLGLAERSLLHFVIDRLGFEPEPPMTPLQLAEKIESL